VILSVFIFAMLLVAQDNIGQAWKILNAGTSSESFETRVKAIQALDLIGKNPKAEQIALAALRDKKFEVQIAAVSALGSVGSNACVPEIKKVLPSAGSELMFAAANAFFKLNDPAAYEIYYAALTREMKSGQGLVESQMKLLRNPKAMAMVGFEQGIGFIPFAGLGYGAFKSFTKDDESPVRAAAAIRLATDKDPKSGAALAKAVNDEKWMVSAAAIAAIGMRGDPVLMKAVIPKMQDKNETVRFNAAACVIRLGK
jgi:HEAT repeat protein